MLQEPIVITGIGMITSVGHDRESVWQAIQQGKSGARKLTGIRSIPDNLLIGAPVDIPNAPGRLKTLTLCEHAADEAMADAKIDFDQVNRERFACAVSGHMGDSSYLVERNGFQHLLDPQAPPFWHQWLPNTACSVVANRFQLEGPRICHSTACASGLVDILSAVRAIEDGQADIALAGSGEAIDPLFAAGFNRMRVLAYDDDPTKACRPFDRNRHGFIMGEGAAMFVIERLSHALARNVPIYAEFRGGKKLAEAHHVTGLDSESDGLTHLINITLADAELAADEVDYVNAHGTGTTQNDLVEMRGIRRALGSAADNLCVSANKSILGHLVNAAGSVELAITALALRDGFAPPTLNLTDPDPECDLDCVPLMGRERRFQHALKLSIAFGGHLVAVALSRWNDTSTGFGYPDPLRRAA